jgi:glucokinase
VVDTLKAAFGKDVILLNDATAGALAERVYGAGKHHPNLVYVTMSTGIGGGAMVDGRLLMGKDGNAVEAGHLTVDSLFRLACGCGKRGHWEGYCSGRNIPQFAQLIINNLSSNEKRAFPRSRLLVGQGRMTTKGIFWEASSGDSLALKIIDEVGRLNSIGISDLVSLFDPSLITVGGSVALNNSAQIVGSVKRNMGHHAMTRLPMISVTPLGEDIVLLGAVAAALNPLPGG